MKNLFVVKLLFILCSSLAVANPFKFVKDCSDFNNKNVIFLDSLLQSADSTISYGNKITKTILPGITLEGKSCQVVIERTQGISYCKLPFVSYSVGITVDSNSEKEKACYGRVIMDVDLDINNNTEMSYKTTYVYPRIFSSDFDQVKAKTNSHKYNFSCESYIKNKPGYRVGHYFKNECLILNH